MRARLWLLGCAVAALVACGNNGGGTTDSNGSGDGDGGGSSDDAGMIDAPFSGMCTVGGTTECSDCIDNDSDGKIDGFDPQCSGPADRREDSFATGIPGDNIDATNQDCFFDGNSGGGDDGCNQHVCCLLQADGGNLQQQRAKCAELTAGTGANANQYNKDNCYAPFGSVPVPQKCKDVCAPLTTPGCDCFGCCTICNDVGCADIIQNPAVSPNCTQANITDFGPDTVDKTGDEPCKRCVKSDCGNTECHSDPQSTSCTLCPGQDPSTLPSSCSGNSCPDGYVACDGAGNCPIDTYCSNGCCIGTLL